MSRAEERQASAAKPMTRHPRAEGRRSVAAGLNFQPGAKARRRRSTALQDLDRAHMIDVGGRVSLRKGYGTTSSAAVQRTQSCLSGRHG
jgi:hypothetical protein